MKVTYSFFVTACVALLISTGQGATVYNGSGRIDQNNWDNGIPDTVGNPGTINSATGANGELRSGTYFITQNAGDLVNTFGANTLSSGQWTMAGGSITSGNDFLITTSQVFTQNGGTITINDDLIVTTSAIFTLNNGLLIPNDDLELSSSFFMTGGQITTDGTGTPAVDGRIALSSGGSFTISGGVVSLNGGIGTFGSAVGNMAFNGGTITALNFSFAGSGTSATFGGSASGSLTASNFAGTAANRDINWLPGSLMSLTLSAAAANWAETEWAAGRLTYNDQGVGVLGAWATVNGTIFDYDSDTRTLSLISTTSPSLPFAITSFTAVADSPGVWQITLTGVVSTNYVFRSSTNLDFTASGIVENLATGVPAVGTIGGTNNNRVTTDSNGQATVRVTLTGHPAQFIRAESEP